MKKYTYHYFIFTNNCCYGWMKLNEYRTKAAAREAYYNYYMHKYGACDIVKKRVYITEN